MSNVYPKPGTIGLSVIGGTVGGMIRLGQGLTGDWSYWTHAFLTLDNGEVIQAMPKGAEIVPLSGYAESAVFLTQWPRPTDTQRLDIVRWARVQEGRKYNFLDYVYLALPSALRGVLREHIKKSGRVICSQLVDEAYRYAGIQLFDDGREPHDVTPGDLVIEYVRRLSEYEPPAPDVQ